MLNLANIHFNLLLWPNQKEVKNIASLSQVEAPQSSVCAPSCWLNKNFQYLLIPRSCYLQKGWKTLRKNSQPSKVDEVKRKLKTFLEEPVHPKWSKKLVCLWEQTLLSPIISLLCYFTATISKDSNYGTTSLLIRNHFLYSE